ncbi:hypothetical protein QYY77_04795 [Xanthomonas campestris pv. campestris]|uniref:hypothetical protein n=1 Tax=Xanthomonas campestris TaxID=339 RepID=UPI001E5CA9F2|nr:hypothetical protein [Xanthomonas campestris]MCC5070362.1 hypothetical protein [Xanthomonas campestris]MEA0735404.1 hypothetical protein [Xanthomonas campestris pv. campestris]MEB2188170.1 hypothetical protein [Xanthomonas campestris pv. campestris]
MKYKSVRGDKALLAGAGTFCVCLITALLLFFLKYQKIIDVPFIFFGLLSIVMAVAVIFTAQHGLNNYLRK